MARKMSSSDGTCEQSLASPLSNGYVLAYLLDTVFLPVSSSYYDGCATVNLTVEHPVVGLATPGLSIDGHHAW